jgi:iron complex outermembrane receptor protein
MRSSMLPFTIWALTTLALAAAARPALGSGDPGPATSGRIAGRVTDTTGAPLAEARVKIVELGRSVTTDADGHYSLLSVPSGTYQVSFAHIGYAPQIRRVTVGNADVSLDVVLKESAIELSEVQVTATPTATDPLLSPQPTAVLGEADLRTAQAPSLGETLSGLAGVHSWSTGIGIGKPVIRGLTANRVLVLENGQRLETQQWGDEHSPNIETADAERIEVIRGPASVLYGSDALGGVVNVIPKELPDAIGRPAFSSGTFSAAYGTNNREPDATLSFEGAREGLGFRASLTGRTSEDVKTPSYTLWNSGNLAVGGSASVGYRSAWGSLAGTFTQRDERIELTDEDPTATPTQRMSTSVGRVDLTLPMGAARLEVTTGYERSRRREFEDDTTTTVGLGLLSQTYTADVHFHHAPLGRLKGVLGFSGVRTTFDKFGEETLIPNSTANAAGVYAFEQADAGRWSLSFGARYDYRNLDVEQDADLGVAAQTRTYNSVTGNLGVLYHVAEPVAIVLNVGRGFRAPSSFDLFANGVHEGTVAFEHGNPNLTTEKSVNTDLALRVQSGRVALEFGGFVNLIQDYIYTFPTGATDPGSGFPIYDATQGDARLTGVETSVEYHPTRSLHLQGTADYVRGQNTTTDQPLPNMPPFRATYTVRYEGKGSQVFQDPYVSIGGQSNAAQTRLDPAERQFYDQAFGGSGYRSTAYTLVNLGAGFAVPAGGSLMRFDFTVHNALDQDFADYLTRIKTNAPDPGQGRNFVTRVTWEF